MNTEEIQRLSALLSAAQEATDKARAEVLLSPLSDEPEGSLSKELYARALRDITEAEAAARSARNNINMIY